MRNSSHDPFTLLEDLNAIGVALSAEKDHDRLLEMILDKAQWMTNADGGTLYSVTEDGHLKFEIMHTESLGIRMGGKSGAPVDLPVVPLYLDPGNTQPNMRMVAASAALKRETINIADVYAAREFDFSGTREFDERTGYRSQSFLTVPMTNHENEVIGVLQLLNARDPVTGTVIAFSRLDQRLVESLASQAAVTLTNKSLIDAQRKLFDALIQLIAGAIDEKSPYTAGHCRRVPILTDMLAEAACRTQVGALKNFTMTEEERYELSVAAWLHDCGKIVTPEFVVDKSTKLETIFDRIGLIDARFEVLKRDARIAMLEERLRRLGGAVPSDTLDAECAKRIRDLEDQRDFLRRVNIGGESLSDADCARIQAIAEQRWRDGSGEEVPVLTPDEVVNLMVSRGTLTAAERAIINNHVSVTIKMLQSLPYPRHLRRVPEYAGGHHERMDGTGYPRGLRRDAMPIPARMVAIADIFEALTAEDRPYKKPMPLSKALAVLGRMKLDNHVDPDLFDVFIREKVYLRYAEQFLKPEQIDEVDVTSIPGYDPEPSEHAGA